MNTQLSIVKLQMNFDLLSAYLKFSCDMNEQRPNIQIIGSTCYMQLYC